MVRLATFQVSHDEGGAEELRECGILLPLLYVDDHIVGFCDTGRVYAVKPQKYSDVLSGSNCVIRASRDRMPCSGK